MVLYCTVITLPQGHDYSCGVRFSRGVLTLLLGTADTKALGAKAVLFSLTRTKGPYVSGLQL